MKVSSHIDEKEQLALFCKAEDKGLHNLLVSEKILTKKTLNIAINLLLKISNESKHKQSVLDFFGMNLIQKTKPFLKSLSEDKEEGNS